VVAIKIFDEQSIISFEDCALEKLYYEITMPCKSSIIQKNLIKRPVHFFNKIIKFDKN